MPLSFKQEQLLQVIDRCSIIHSSDDRVCPGIHFCPDWDFLPVCDDSPEKDGCTCGEVISRLRPGKVQHRASS